MLDMSFKSLCFICRTPVEKPENNLIIKLNTHNLGFNKHLGIREGYIF